MNPSDDPQFPPATSPASLAEECRRLAAERDALLAALTEAHGTIEDLDRRITAANRQRAAGQQGLVKMFSALADARAELERVRHSRLWRLATAYWRLREILGIGGRGAAAVVDRPSSPGISPPPAPVRRRHQRSPCRRPGARRSTTSSAFRSSNGISGSSVRSSSCRSSPRPVTGSSTCRSASGSRGAPFEITPKIENVYEVTLLGPGMNVYRSNPGAAAVDLLFSALDRLRRDAGIGAAAALVQLPFWWPLLRRARREFAWPVVYDCMDLHTGFSTNTGAMMENEDDLLRSADLVAVSSRSSRPAPAR